MNQTELAELTGYSRFGISRILSGKRNASRLGAARLAKIVPGTNLIDWLFAEKNWKRLSKIVRSLQDGK